MSKLTWRYRHYDKAWFPSDRNAIVKSQDQNMFWLAANVFVKIQGIYWPKQVQSFSLVSINYHDNDHFRVKTKRLA